MKYLPLETPGKGHTGYQQQVKEANIKRIFDLVRSGKCKSRAEIVRYMNLSATSVSVLVEELAARGLIDETGPTHTSLPGRRPISLRLNSDAHQMAVFSLRGEGINYVLLNLECKMIEKRFFPMDFTQVPADEVGAESIRLIEDILRRRAKRFERGKALIVGISCPGVYCADEGTFYVRSASGIHLTEEPVRRFQQRMELPIYLSNDTRSMAYAEKKLLDAADPDGPETQDMLFVEIRNGVGCAIISGGNIYTGPYNVAGEIGHMTIDHRGRPCPCGSRGCLERYVNLNSLLEDARQAAEAAGIEPPESMAALAKRYPDEPVLQKPLYESARILASGLYSLMCGSGMRRIVLGGGIEVLGQPFLEEVRRCLRERTMLIHHLYLDYAQSGPNGENIGLAQHFLDKVFTVTM